MRKNLFLTLVVIGFWFHILIGRNDSQIFADVTDVDPQKYSGQTFRVTGVDGLPYYLPVYRDEAGRLRSNNFSWYDDGSYHQGYVCYDQGRVMIVECDGFSDASYDGLENPSSVLSGDTSVESVQQKDVRDHMSLQSLDHEHSHFVAQQKSNYAQMQYVYKVELMAMLGDCAVAVHQGKAIRVWNRDRPLFEAICHDNQAIDPVVLCGMLAQDQRFNYLHYFCCDKKKIKIPDISPDIVINLDLFNKVDNPAYRQALYHELTQHAADHKKEQERKQQKIDARHAYRACQKDHIRQQSALSQEQKKEREALERDHKCEQAAVRGDKHQQDRLRAVHERQNRELVIKHAHQQTLLDAQQYQERPTVRGWLHEKVSKFVYGCTSSAKNKTAEVLQHEACQKAARRAKSEKVLDKQRCTKAKKDISLHDVTTSFESFVGNDAVASIQNLYEDYETKSNCSVSHHAHAYSQVIKLRVNALQQSCEQPIVTTRNFLCDAQTAGCMQAYGVDAQKFSQVQGLPISHQITQELIDIFTGISKLNYQQLADSAVLIQVCSNLVQAAQGENVDKNFLQVLQSANCSHGLLHYIQGCYRSGVDTIEQMMTASAYFNDVLVSFHPISSNVL